MSSQLMSRIDQDTDSVDIEIDEIFALTSREFNNIIIKENNLNIEAPPEAPVTDSKRHRTWPVDGHLSQSGLLRTWDIRRSSFPNIRETSNYIYCERPTFFNSKALSNCGAVGIRECFDPGQSFKMIDVDEFKNAAINKTVNQLNCSTNTIALYGSQQGFNDEVYELSDEQYRSSRANCSFKMIDIEDFKKQTPNAVNDSVNTIAVYNEACKSHQLLQNGDKDYESDDNHCTDGLSNDPNTAGYTPSFANKKGIANTAHSFKMLDVDEFKRDILANAKKQNSRSLMTEEPTDDDSDQYDDAEHTNQRFPSWTIAADQDKKQGYLVSLSNNGITEAAARSNIEEITQGLVKV